MTEQMRGAIYGINKFMFFSWNYAMTEIERNGRRMCLPKFIVEAKWSCNLDHIIGKWYGCITDSKGNQRDSYAFLPRFYAELDGENRRALLDYVMEHREGECASGVSMND